MVCQPCHASSCAAGSRLLRSVLEFRQLPAALAVAGCGAVRACAVHAFHLRGEAGKLGQLGRVVRRGHRGAQLEQHDRARCFRRHLLAFELPGLFDPAVECGQVLLVGFRGEQLAVVVDVGARQPLRCSELGVHRLEFGIDARDEFVGGLVLAFCAGAGGGRSRVGRRFALAPGKGEARRDGEYEQSMALDHGVVLRELLAERAG